MSVEQGEQLPGVQRRKGEGVQRCYLPQVFLLAAVLSWRWHLLSGVERCEVWSFALTLHLQMEILRDKTRRHPHLFARCETI